MKKLILILILLNVFCKNSFAKENDSINIRIKAISSINFDGDTVSYIDLLKEYKWLVKIKDKNGQVVKTSYELFKDIIFQKNKTVCIYKTFVLDSAVLLNNYVISYSPKDSFILRIDSEKVIENISEKNNKEIIQFLKPDDKYCHILFKNNKVQFEIEYQPNTNRIPISLFKIGTEDWKERAIAEQKLTTMLITSFGILFLVLGSVFLILFLFLRVVTENLYFSIFCLCFALLPLLILTGTDHLFENVSVFFIILSISIESMLRFLSKILLDKSRNNIGLLTFFIISLIIPPLYLGNIVPGNEMSINEIIIFFSLLIYYLISILYYLLKGIYKNKWEAKFIGYVGLLSIVLPPIVALIWDYISGNVKNEFYFGINFNYFVVLIPVAMTIILGKRNVDNHKQVIRQLIEIEKLSVEKQSILEKQKKTLEEKVIERTAELVAEKKEVEKQRERSEELLLNILPFEVAEQLKAKGSADAKQFDEVTVMFTDFKNFTQISEKLTPTELVAEIDYCFKTFDNIVSRHGIEKIKTIGDSYMCAGGLPIANNTNATDVINAAIEIQEFMLQHIQQRKDEGKEPFEIRIGVHTGAVVAGIVGIKKFAYDIWGETVNIASRMESSGEVGRVNISGATYELIKDQFRCVHRGKIQAKNKGEIDMYFVERF